MKNFLRNLSVGIVFTLGLTACGEDDKVVEQSQPQVIVQKQVVTQPVFVPLPDIPVVVQNYTMLDVERNYRQCLIQYGLHSDDYCESRCSFKYDEDSCDTIEDYYEDRYGIGRDSYNYDVFIVSKPYNTGKVYRTNSNYSTRSKTVYVSKTPVPTRVTTIGKNGEVKYNNQFSKTGSKTVVQSSGVKTISSTQTAGKVQTISSVKSDPNKVTKLGTGEQAKLGNQFTSGGQVKSQVTNSDLKTINAQPNADVKKLGAGGTQKYDNQFVKKPEEKKVEESSVSSGELAMVAAAGVGTAAVVSAKKDTNNISSINSQSKLKNQFTKPSVSTDKAKQEASRKAEEKRKADAASKAEAERKADAASKAEAERKRRAEADRKRRADAERKRKQEQQQKNSSSKNKKY